MNCFKFLMFKMYLGNQLKSWRKLFNVIFDNDKKKYFKYWIMIFKLP